MQYLKQLGAQAGHPVDLSRLDGRESISASIEANRGEYDRMTDCILKSVSGRETVRDEEALDRDYAKSLEDRYVEDSREYSGWDQDRDRDDGMER